MRFPFLLSVVAACLLILSPSTRAERVYTIGNSVTDTINFTGFVALAESRGYTQPWGRQMIPGAPLEWLWDHPNDGFTQSPYGYPTNALVNYSWDTLSLQPFDRSLNSDIDYMQRYLGLLYGTTSPTAAQSANRLDTRILIPGRWPRQDAADRVGGPRDYDTLWLRAYTNFASGENVESADFANDVTLALRGVTVSGVSLADRTFMVPVGHVMYELNQQMKAGQVPGYTNIFQIYADGIHLTNVGQYLTACTYFAVVYRESPIGLPVPSQYNTIAPDLALRIQEIVWNVVQTQTLSGVPSAGNMLLSTLAVPPGYMNQPYSTSFLAVGGVLPRNYNVTAGSLPNGVTLSTSGTLAGTPTQSGDFNFTVTLTDSTSPTPISVTRNFTLRIDVDTSPVITTPAALPSVSRGSRCDIPLAANGGNGQLSWSLQSGTLPPGIQLGQGGILFGSALTAGNYAFTLKVSDIDSPPDTDTRAFTMTVGAPSAETLLLSRTLSPIRIDGDFTETHWNLNNNAARPLLGDPDNTTQFSTLWDAENLYIAAFVTDSQLSNGSGIGSDRDAIEIFLDAYNDKQAEFNVQHRQFRVALDGVLFERGGRTAGVKHTLLKTPGGYQLEMSIPWTNLAITPTADQTVIGFDLANDDTDYLTTREHYQSFAFSDPVDPSPSQFGNAILTNSTVSGTGGEPYGASGPAPIAYEPFDYSLGLLHDKGGTPSFGFNGNWAVENATSPGYAIEGTESLVFGQLGTSGRYMTGGHSYQTTGRYLDMASAFLPWKRPSDNFVGKDGTTLWISYLARPLKAGSTMKFSLDDSAAVVHDNNGRLRVQQSSGVWRLSLMYTNSITPSSVLAPTTVTVTANTTYFMVIRIDFGSTDNVKLYVNPALAASPPASASASASTSDANFRFSELQFYPGSSAGDGQFDELRIGATWESVTPAPATPVAPVTFSPLPGTYAEAPSISLTSPTAGATIYYTTDGSTPTISSAVYSTPIVISESSTLRALAIKSGAPQSPVSGGTYFLVSQSPFLNWSEGIDWQGADPEAEADPEGDGIKNFLEYALGLDPLASSVPPVAMDVTPPFISFSYPRAQADVTYTVEMSTTLTPDSWTSEGVIQDTTTPVGGTATATVPYNPETMPACFLRLSVSE